MVWVKPQEILLTNTLLWWVCSCRYTWSLTPWPLHPSVCHLQY